MSEAKRNPVAIEDQAPSAAAKERLDEQTLEFRKKVHESAPPSDLINGDRVEFRADREYESLTSQSRRKTGDRAGTVVGQAFVASEDSNHAGKVCRGVMLDGGDLVTTPEDDLVRSGRGRVAGFRVSQSRWDAIFGSKKKRARQ